MYTSPLKVQAARTADRENAEREMQRRSPSIIMYDLITSKMFHANIIISSIIIIIIIVRFVSIAIIITLMIRGGRGRRGKATRPPPPPSPSPVPGRYLMHIYIYIYVYIWVMSYPPPCFLTTLQYTKLHGVQAKLSHLYIIMQNKSLHMKNINHLLISKRLLSIVRGFHELFVFIRKALPSIVRELFLL